MGDMEKPPNQTLARNESLVKDFPKKNWKRTVIMALCAFLVVGAGVGTGYSLSGKTFDKGDKSTAPGATSSASEAGLTDEATFRDSAEGKLVAGGIEGEGTHHLDRDLGPEKYVYLTSTVIDLESFVGKKATVWGETITARNAGWLMDVGKIKVSE